MAVWTVTPAEFRELADVLRPVLVGFVLELSEMLGKRFTRARAEEHVRERLDWLAAELAAEAKERGRDREPGPQPDWREERRRTVRAPRITRLNRYRGS